MQGRARPPRRSTEGRVVTLTDITVPRCPVCGGAPDEGGGYWHQRDGSIMHAKCDPEWGAPPPRRLLSPELDAALYRELIPRRITAPDGTRMADGPTARWAADDRLG
jgi:hypothetical protein